jgi:hypothetical protein
MTPTVSDALREADQLLLSKTPRVPLVQLMKPRRFYHTATTKLASEVAKSCRVSVLDLSPYPKAESNLQIRKRRAQNAEIITSSPFKAVVEQQETLKNAKSAKQAANSARASSKKLKQMQKVEVKKPSSRAPKPQIRKTETNKKKIVDIDLHCIFCSELFVEPPTEDWIQCNKCVQWCHEACADTDCIDKNGNFVCGVC